MHADTKINESGHGNKYMGRALHIDKSLGEDNEAWTYTHSVSPSISPARCPFATLRIAFDILQNMQKHYDN